MSRIKGTFPVSANFEVKIKGEFDARKYVATYAELLSFSQDSYIPYGFTVTCAGTDDLLKRGLWMCVNDTDLSNPASWFKLTNDVPVNSLVSTAGIIQSGLTVTVKGPTVWDSVGVAKTVTGDTTFNIIPATTGYTKIAIIYGRNDSTLDIVYGNESKQASVEPNLPINTVRIAPIYIKEDSISGVIPDLSGYARLGYDNSFTADNTFNGKLYLKNLNQGTSGSFQSLIGVNNDGEVVTYSGVTVSTSPIPVSGGTEAFSTGGAFAELAKKADLVNGVVPASQLPSFVDDVLEFDSFSTFPTNGETGKIYIAKNTNKVYRWSGSVYVQISSSPGTTDDVVEGVNNLYFTNARVKAYADTLYVPLTRTITTSGPLSGGGTLSSNLTLSILQANSSQGGYLSSVDWNAFNAKQSALSGTGIVKSVSGTISYINGTNVQFVKADGSLDNNVYITGITSSNVISALGYTPYNATNPAGYITLSALTGYATQTWVVDNFYTKNQTADLYYPLNSNPAGYITSASLPDLSPYALKNGSNATGIWPISISGSAVKWNGQDFTNEDATSLTKLMVLSNGVWKYGTSSLVQAFLGLNNGSTLNNNISGNATTATTSANSTKWAGFDYVGSVLSPVHVLAYNGVGWGYTTATDLRTFLGNYGNWITESYANTLYSKLNHTHTWNQITDRPTNLSQFTNDSDFVTSDDLADIHIGIANSTGVSQFDLYNTNKLRFEGSGDTSISFDPATNKVIITSVPGSGTGGAVTSFNGRTGAISSQEGDYTTAQVTEFNNLYYTNARVKAYADTLYSLLGHTHTWNQITDRPTQLSQFTNNLGNYGNWITKVQGDSWYSLLGHTHTWSEITAKPTTIAGYGINNAYTKSEVDGIFTSVGTNHYTKSQSDERYYPLNSNPAGYITSVSWGNVGGRPTNLSQFTNDLGNYGGWAKIDGSNATGIWGISITGTSNYARYLNLNHPGSLSQDLPTGIYRNEGGQGDNIFSYSPVLNVSGVDTKWQLQAEHGPISTRLRFRGGFYSDFSPWREIYNDGDIQRVKNDLGLGTNAYQSKTNLSQYVNDLGNYGGWLLADGATYAGFAGDNIDAPYMRHTTSNSVVTLARSSGENATGTWGISVTGSAKGWNGQLYAPIELTNNIQWFLGYDSNTQQWKPTGASILKDFINLDFQAVTNTGRRTTSAIGVNLVYGNADPTISLAIGDYDTGLHAISDGVTAYYSNGVQLYRLNHAPSIQSFLGLGSLAYINNGDNIASFTTGGASFSNYVSSPDGSRNPNDIFPRNNPNRVRFDFVNAGGHTTTGGNYAGVMTYSPWQGTIASTGDASYQLAFGSSEANEHGVPQLRIRKGIETSWYSWYKIYTSANTVEIQSDLGLGSLAYRNEVPSTGEAPWSLVQRDSGGNVHAVYYKMTGPAVDAIGVSDIVTTAGDGYLRRSSAATVKSFLGLTSMASENYLLYHRYNTFTADANTVPEHTSNFTYQLNAPYNGYLGHFGAQGYGLQLNGQYGDGRKLSMRQRNGDAAAWNPWFQIYHSGDTNQVKSDLGLGTFAYKSAIAGSEIDTHINNTPYDIGVAKMIRWRNYGDGHAIFDASAGLAPNGVAIDKTNPQYGWSPLLPNLMGWNGNATYAVRVDSSRYSESSVIAERLKSYNGTNGINWGWDGNVVTFKVDASDFAGSIPMNITGSAASARSWGGAIYTGTEVSSIQHYIIGYSESDGTYHPANVNAVRNWLGLGSAAYINATATHNAANTVVQRDSNGYLGGENIFVGYAGKYLSTMFSEETLDLVASRNNSLYRDINLRNGTTLRYYNSDDSFAGRSDMHGDILHNYTTRSSDGSPVAWKENWWDGANYHSLSVQAAGFLSGSRWRIGGGTGKGYDSAPLELLGNEAIPPRLGLHMQGVVASSISIGTDGAIEMLNNPGTGYEQVRAKDFRASERVVAGIDVQGTYTYGTTFVNGGRVWTGWDSGQTGAVSASNWFRSNGTSGWLSSDFGGGIYMSDSTWVRIYANKAFWVDNTIRGVDVVATNNFFTNNYGGGFVGVYDASRYQAVFSMGAAYVPSLDGTSLNNSYGIVWTHSNVGGQSKSGLGHQMLITEAGVTQTAIGNGIWTRANIYAAGYITGAGGGGTSDIRHKNVIDNTLDLSWLDKDRTIAFTWKNGPDTKTHYGYSAQEIYLWCPDLIFKDDPNKLALNQVELLTLEVKRLKERITELEK